MNDEIKEILDYLKIENGTIGSELSYEETHLLLDYITNLQQENERLKNNQVKALNRIKDFINSSRCEIAEGSYCNDKHSQYWMMFKQFAEELQDKIKGLDTKDYVYIPKWREEELLNQEEQLENYKSRCEKANDKIQYIIDYGFDYDGFNTVESLKGLIDMLVDYARESKNILQNGSEKDD